MVGKIQQYQYYILTVIVSVGLSFGAFTLFSSNKTAYINTSVLMEKSVAMQDVRRQLKESINKAKQNIDTLQREFEVEMKRYEKRASSMSAKEKQLAQELLKMKQGELVRYNQAIEGKMGQQEQKLTTEALKTINDYITEYGKKHHYKIIFATVNGNVAYADESLDITNEIIKGVNEKLR